MTNVELVEPYVTYASDVGESRRVALTDAQTSGGLLIAVPAERADRLTQLLRERGTYAAAVIGELIAGEPGTIRVEQ